MSQFHFNELKTKKISTKNNVKIFLSDFCKKQTPKNSFKNHIFKCIHTWEILEKHEDKLFTKTRHDAYPSLKLGGYIFIKHVISLRD